MNCEVCNEKWYIFMIGLDKAYVLGESGKYEREISMGMWFSEKIDAIEYVEEHGYQRITTIRRARSILLSSSSNLFALS